MTALGQRPLGDHGIANRLRVRAASRHQRVGDGRDHQMVTGGQDPQQWNSPSSSGAASSPVSSTTNDRRRALRNTEALRAACQQRRLGGPVTGIGQFDRRGGTRVIPADLDGISASSPFTTTAGA